MIRIGFDIDGVLANFYDAYERRTISVTGRNIFPKRPQGVYPPVWNWPEYYGYTDAEMEAVWASIKRDPIFWQGLPELPDMETLREFLDTEPNAEIYFVTARPGHRVKEQTEFWMDNMISRPSTILISEEKGMIARALRLDVYVDDKAENCNDVVERSPQTRVYMPWREYNNGLQVPQVKVVRDLRAVLEAERFFLPAPSGRGSAATTCSMTRSGGT